MRPLGGDSPLGSGADEAGGESHDGGDELVRLRAVALGAARLALGEVVCRRQVVEGVGATLCERHLVVGRVGSWMTTQPADAVAVTHDLGVACSCRSSVLAGQRSSLSVLTTYMQSATLSACPTS